MDLLEYEGVWNIVTPSGGTWIELLENEKTREIRRKEGCSAIGAPRAKWKVSDNRLWMVGLFKCGGEIKLETVYGGNGEPISAEWVTEDLVTQRGKTLCHPHYGGAGILETSIFIRVRRGVVTQVAQMSNRGNPAIPTVEKLRKIFGPEYAHMAEELLDDWPCLEAHNLRQLQDEPSVDSPPKGSTLGEYLNDHARKLLRNEEK